MKKHHNAHGGTRKGASRKKELALALCVSLWMAGGGVVSANTGLGTKTINNQLALVGIEGWTGNNAIYDGSPRTVSVVAGGYASQSKVTNNTITIKISGNTPLTEVYGGYAYYYYEVTNNTVIIESGKLNNANIYGGYAYIINSNSLNVTNNKVIIKGGTLDGANIYGGKGAGSGHVVTGNTLSVSGAYKPASVQNFSNINIEGATWDTPVLTLTGAGIVSNGDGTKTKIDASTLTFAKPETVADGATMNLIKCENAATITADLAATTTALQAYTVTPVTGVLVNAAFQGQLNIPDDKKALVCTASNKASKLTFTDVEWKDTGALLDHTATLTNVSFDGANVDTTKLAFTNPENRSAGDAMTLIANAGALANPENTVSQSYAQNPVDGLSIDAALNGSVALSGNDLTYSVTSNKATKLSFGSVAWKDTDALLDHAATLTNVSFDGADVDTTKINFTNIQSLEANKKMTLVSNFGGKPGSITGEKYTVGTALEGKGKASMVGEDLIFTAETGTGDDSGLVTQEQTHNGVMGAEVSMAALSMGNDFIGHATDGLSLASNVGADGVSTFAQMGGGSMRQETGSHIDSHTWNAILALGHANKKERGTTEYGAFFEYGTGNYTTQSDEGRGDGSSRYTGGGILGKYTLANGVYVEGSFRAGTVHDDARDVLHDANGVGYSYDTNANYLGAHIGFGKEIQVTGGNVVDVYGKYFYNRRNSVSFDVAAGDHYDLDAVTSSVIRVGARYNVKRAKWNFYAGAAYEHELDGKAAGTASNGGVSAPIRGADVGGASFRGELGATMTPGENSPWKLDLNVTGFAGKKQGFTGGVSVAFMF